MDDRLFGKYRPIRLLGRGGMGEVWLVQHLALDVERAVKTMTMPKCQESRVRFELEARTLARLRHPNLPVVHDFVFEGTISYLEMDLILGQPLSEFVWPDCAQCRQETILHFAEQLCDVLGYCHQNDTIHRDLKHANLMVEANPIDPLRPRLFLVDFGVAKIFNQPGITRHDQFVGTYPCASPEQFDDPLGVDHRSDLYSASLIFVELITGQRPNRWSIANLDSLRSYCPRSLCPYVQRWLALDRNQRPQSARELLGEIREYFALIS